MSTILERTRHARRRPFAALVGLALLIGAAGFAPRQAGAPTGGGCGEFTVGTGYSRCYDPSDKAAVEALSPLPLLDPDAIVRGVTGLSLNRLKVDWDTSREPWVGPDGYAVFSVEYDYYDVTPPPPHNISNGIDPYLKIREFPGAAWGSDQAPVHDLSYGSDDYLWKVLPAGKPEMRIESNLGADHGRAVVTAIGEAMLNGTDPATLAPVVTPQAQGRPTPSPVVGTVTPTATGPAAVPTEVATATGTPTPTLGATATATVTVTPPTATGTPTSILGATATATATVTPPTATAPVTTVAPLTPTTALSITAGGPPLPPVALAAALGPHGVVAVRLRTRPFARVTLALDVLAGLRGHTPAPRLRSPWVPAARQRRTADRHGLLDTRQALPAGVARAGGVRLTVQVRAGRGWVVGYALLRLPSQRR